MASEIASYIFIIIFITIIIIFYNYKLVMLQIYKFLSLEKIKYTLKAQIGVWVLLRIFYFTRRVYVLKLCM